MDNFHEWMTQPKGCLLIGIGGFILASIGVSLTLVFGGDINEPNYDYNMDSEYSALDNLKTSFFAMIVCVIFYFIWKNNIDKGNNKE